MITKRRKLNSNSSTYSGIQARAPKPDRKLKNLQSKPETPNGTTPNRTEHEIFQPHILRQLWGNSLQFFLSCLKININTLITVTHRDYYCYYYYFNEKILNIGINPISTEKNQVHFHLGDKNIMVK